MATRVGCGKIRLASFNNSFPKLPIRRKDLGDISYRIRLIALFSQISLPWQQGSVGVKIFGSIR